MIMLFYLPVKIFQEKDCVRNHADEWCALGSRAMIVTGRSSSAKNGSLVDVTSSLEERNIPYIVFDEVEENPSVETVIRAGRIGIEAGVDFVIGIGGGSPLDAAKAIAIVIKNPGCDGTAVVGPEKMEAVPVISVPTTCGTGSEATPYAILTRHDLKTKGSIPNKVFPVYALVDSKYLKAAPRSVICNTAMDAFAHLCESYINTNATEISRMLSDKGFEIWARCKDVLSGDKTPDEADLDDLMNASTLGGMAISHTGTSLPHGLSYQLTYNTGMPHGMAVGYFQAGYLKESPIQLREHVLKMSGFESAEELAEFYRKICEPGTAPDRILEMALEDVISNEAKLRNCPYTVTEDILRRIMYY